MKPPEIIKNSCCSALLEVPKCQLVDSVKGLEVDNERLTIENQELKNDNFNFSIYFWIMIFAFYVWVFA